MKYIHQTHINAAGRGEHEEDARTATKTADDERRGMIAFTLFLIHGEMEHIAAYNRCQKDRSAAILFHI